MTIRLVQTCGACPEQYDAFVDDGTEIVGYLRLRHGSFTVECPNSGDALVYHANPKGDGLFEYEERDYYLRFAVAAIEAWIENPATEAGLPPAPDVEYIIE